MKETDGSYWCVPPERKKRKPEQENKNKRVDCIELVVVPPRHLKHLTLLCQLPLVTRKTISEYSTDCPI